MGRQRIPIGGQLQGAEAQHLHSPLFVAGLAIGHAGQGMPAPGGDFQHPRHPGRGRQGGFGLGRVPGVGGVDPVLGRGLPEQPGLHLPALKGELLPEFAAHRKLPGIGVGGVDFRPGRQVGPADLVGAIGPQGVLGRIGEVGRRGGEAARGIQAGRGQQLRRHGLRGGGGQDQDPQGKRLECDHGISPAEPAPYSLGPAPVRPIPPPG